MIPDLEGSGGEKKAFLIKKCHSSIFITAKKNLILNLIMILRNPSLEKEDWLGHSVPEVST